MNKASTFFSGMAMGAGAMYLLDPDRGSRRRALMRDQLVHALHKAEDAVEVSGRDLRNRARGVAAETMARLRSEDVEDHILEARVRSRLGRVVSHPGAIDVSAREGSVRLSGLILADELDRTIAAIEGVRGVAQVIDELEVHTEADDISALQGGAEPEADLDVLQEHWAPATRLLMGVAGGAIAWYARRLPPPLSTAVSGVGMGIVARAVTNMEAARLVGLEPAERAAIAVHKTVHVDAPVEEVFEFWSRFEDFPRFMSHLEDVERTGEGTSHWVARGPGGLVLEWDAIVTDWAENELIEWRSLPDADVINEGRIRFQEDERGGTRVDVHYSYTPPGGALGHAVASFFGSDLKSALDEDLVRFQSLIEEGKTTARGEEVHREDLAEEGNTPKRTRKPTGRRRSGGTTETDLGMAAAGEEGERGFESWEDEGGEYRG